MTITYLVSGQAIFDTLESIRLQGGHACDYRYLPDGQAEIKAHFPDQPELPVLCENSNPSSLHSAQ